MIVTMARQVIKPECIEKYHALVEEITIKSNEEPGCISYDNICQEDDKCVHIFVEHWKDQAAIDFHVATEYFTRIVPQFKEFFAEEEVCTRYEMVAYGGQHKKV